VSRAAGGEPIRSIRFAAIDFESAGADPGKGDVPIQIGIAGFGPDSSAIDDQLVSYLATDRPVKWSASKVHGIRSADLDGAPTLLELWPEVNLRLRGNAVVAHGAGTERRFLAAFPGHRFGPWVDTLQVARRVMPDAGSYALGDLCRALSLEEKVRKNVPDSDWHDALFDAAASLFLLAEIITSLELWDSPLEFLMQP